MRRNSYIGFQPFYVKIDVFEHFYQKCRRTGCKPVIPEIFSVEGIQQTERIVHAFAFFGKVITVIIPF
ncbi:MAG: methylenetetrahydrofolate reductase [Planctomycetaceae bacterium]|nr:methylenetetrahydrofolate reductase [Planctomycetaceae bacterium]